MSTEIRDSLSRSLHGVEFKDWSELATFYHQVVALYNGIFGFLGLIAEILDDAPRPGGPATFSPEQIVQIVAVACEPPEKSGRPISHWTHRELADEVKKRQIVKDIAPRSVGRFLKTGRAAAPSQPLLAQCQPA